MTHSDDYLSSQGEEDTIAEGGGEGGKSGVIGERGTEDGRRKSGNRDLQGSRNRNK